MNLLCMYQVNEKKRKKEEDEKQNMGFIYMQIAQISSVFYMMQPMT